VPCLYEHRLPFAQVNFTTTLPNNARLTLRVELRRTPRTVMLSTTDAYAIAADAMKVRSSLYGFFRVFSVRLTNTTNDNTSPISINIRCRSTSTAAIVFRLRTSRARRIDSHCACDSARRRISQSDISLYLSLFSCFRFSVMAMFHIIRFRKRGFVPSLKPFEEQSPLITYGDSMFTFVCLGEC
jgi:hypothetical protein